MRRTISGTGFALGVGKEKIRVLLYLEGEEVGPLVKCGRGEDLRKREREREGAPSLDLDMYLKLRTKRGEIYRCIGRVPKVISLFFMA